MRLRVRIATVTGALATTLAATIVLASCGLPTDDAYKPIDKANLPFGLANTTTTSTTTTTLPPATTTTVQPTTTTAPTTAPVQVYFVAGNTLKSVVRRAPLPVTPLSALQILQAGPVTEPGLRTSLPSGAIVNVTVTEGKATVDLTQAALDQQGQEQLFEFAQIVATLTSQPGIGQVEFRIPGPNGTPQIIPVLRGTGDAATLVSRDNYANLLPPPPPAKG